MNSSEIRQKFFDFFEKEGHKVVPSSSLIPEDGTVLLTSAGMQQFIPYLSGDKDVLVDFESRHLASVQKCFRTGDIEEVGDDTHNTFFQMLGNWSIGEDENGYFKEKAIKMALDFFVNEIGLEKDKLWITIFEGAGEIPKDLEAKEIWLKEGISEDKIVEFDAKDNFWGPVAKTGPCGPCSELHYDRGEEYGCDDPNCGVNCDNCRRFVELWNLVFMEYNKNEEGCYDKLSQRNVDTGIGFERLVSVLAGVDSAYETDLFDSLIKKIEELSGKNYSEDIKSFRIIADHIRGSVFLISDKIIPSNSEQGYILRRILRRAIRYGRILGLEGDYLIELAKIVISEYGDGFPELKENSDNIIEVIKKEEEKFKKTLTQGLAQLESLIKTKEDKEISGKEAFDLYQSYGFPLELTEELAEEKGFSLNKEDFYNYQKEHKEVSRAGAEKKFGGIGGEAGNYEARKLHTAAHMLQAALREVFGDKIQQKGSDINSERMRFDFSYPERIEDDIIKKVEDRVNEIIKKDLEIKRIEMPYKEAIESGALAFFDNKYPETVSVYSITDSEGNTFSKEVCAGPHAERTSELGVFKIKKQKSIGSGIRRIKAILINE
jgi:alanyl-tRNA synthetase